MIKGLQQNYTPMYSGQNQNQGKQKIGFGTVIKFQPTIIEGLAAHSPTEARNLLKFAKVALDDEFKTEASATFENPGFGETINCHIRALGYEKKESNFIAEFIKDPVAVSNKMLTEGFSRIRKEKAQKDILIEFKDNNLLDISK